MNAKLSAAELEVMRHVWAAEGPVTCEALRASLAGEREWKTTTVLTFLSRLADKGMLTVTKRGRANLYAPAVSRRQYEGSETAQFLEEMHGGNVKRMVASLCEAGRLAPGELEELRAWLEAQAGGERG